MAYKVDKLRDHKPQVEALWGAEVLLKFSTEEPTGRYYLWAAALLFSAFAFEAYLNYLGPKLFPSSWDEAERSSWKRKAKKIADKIGFSLDEETRPFQTLTTLFKFRNDMAHPRPVPAEPPYVTDTFDFQTLKPDESDAQKFCTEANARLCFEDVQKMITLLHNQAIQGGRALRAKLGTGHPLRFGHELTSVTPAT